MNNYVTHLPSLGILEISGDDARSFLHGQLTSDLLSLEEGQSGWSAWCQANGRVIVTLLITMTAGHYYLVLPADMAEAVHKRLKMFVLRAQVKIDNISDRYACLGASIDPAETDADPVNWDFSIVRARLPNDTRRTIWITARIEIPALISGLASNDIRIINDLHWQLEDIKSGIAWIGAATTEQALPQELGLEQLRGLSYDKGCYPGQEIVARLHFRGRQKRQLCTALSETPATPGTTVSNATGTNAGLVLAVAQESGGNNLLLLLIDTELTSDRMIQLNGKPHAFTLLYSVDSN